MSDGKHPGDQSIFPDRAAKDAQRAAASEVDMVDHPPHYTAHVSGVECIDVVEHMGFNLGNAMKYLWRAEEKGAPLEDLRKARWYLNREISRREDAA